MSAMSQPSGVVPPPPDVTPDFDYSDPWLFDANMSVIGVGLVLATMSLLLRIYTRVHILHKFGWDDVSIILAWAFSVAIQSVCIYGYKHGGVGIHLWNVTTDLLASFKMVVLVATVLYVPALAFAKFSLIVLYYRIANKNSVFKWSLYILAAIVCGYSIAIVLGLIFGCHPIAKSWDVTITGGHCINKNGLYVATAVTNTATDLALILLPVPVIAKLHKPRAQKVGIILLFAVGCATFVTSILRLATLINFQDSKDITHDLAWPEIWINIEANLIVICPCLPFLRQFFRHHAPRWISEANSLLKVYSVGSGSRGRQHGGFQPHQDEIALADSGSTTTTTSDHNESRVPKHDHWHVTEERGVGQAVSTGSAFYRDQYSAPGADMR